MWPRPQRAPSTFEERNVRLCPKRELSRRKKAALVVARGPALGIALVITVNSVPAGMTQAQDKVLKSLYGLGTDMTVTKAQSAPKTGSRMRGSSTPSGRTPEVSAQQPYGGYGC
ncbi:hypothetical protein ABB07_26940 [Streptomyces incarnatus]|uniref:Uncharacterized protein n=1 Tax=Streptomyces incarnatus TaxID=665007 RepID=A0ABM5TR52_9ACTN|nr:hypothetical protein ABB07_26940 [Streptomyces incarnatus]